MVEQFLLRFVGSGAPARHHVARLVLVLLAQLFDERQVVGVVVLQLLETLKRGFDGGQPGVDLLAIRTWRREDAEVRG